MKDRTISPDKGVGSSGKLSVTTVSILTCGYVFYNLDKSIVGVLIEPIKKEFELSDSGMALLTGAATAIPAALLCIPVGMLADRLSRKRLLIALMIGWSVMTGLCGLARSILALYAARAGVAAFESGYTPVSMSVLSDTFPPERRASAMGIYNLGGSVGIFLGMSMGGAIAAHYGWRAAFFVAGLPGVITGLAVWLFLPEPVRGRFDTGHVSAPASLLAALQAFVRDRVMLFTGFGMACCVIPMVALATWTPSFLIRIYGIDIASAGLAGALIAGAFGSAGAVAGGVLADRVGRNDASLRLLIPLIGTCLSTICGVYAFLTPDIPREWAYGLLSVVGFFGQFYIGTGYATVLGRAAPEQRSTTGSILLVLFTLISFCIGSMIVGTVSDLSKPAFGARSIALGMAAAISFGVLGTALFAAAFVRARSGLRVKNAHTLAGLKP